VKQESTVIITNEYICDFLTSNKGHRFKECHQPEGIKQQILLLVLLKSQDQALKDSYNIENKIIAHVFKKIHKPSHAPAQATSQNRKRTLKTQKPE